MEPKYPRLVSIDTYEGPGPYGKYESFVETSSGEYEPLNEYWREVFKEELSKSETLGDIILKALQEEINKEVLKIIENE